MPTLQFKGKSFVQNHHLAVKFHQLVGVKGKSLTDKVSLHDNLIVQGDNLKALKALLPTYAGKVKCIYIDPPYNTGNEHWTYNDNVNSPMMQEWLGKEVDREDLTRHDKWLCMMMPRLKLLKELLAKDGVIFVSIDDNEQHKLRVLMDEVFGESNFIAQLAVQLNPRGRHLDEFIARTHEHVVIYANDVNRSSTMGGLAKEGAMVEEYDQEDKRGKYRALGLRNRNQSFNPTTRPTLFFPLYVDAATGKVSVEKKGAFKDKVMPVASDGTETCWTWSPKKIIAENELLFATKMKDGTWRVFRKDYLFDEEGNQAETLAKSLWIDKDINNDEGRKALKDLLGESALDFPKSHFLVEKIIKLSTGLDDLILDSFAGSGTTAHAVLKLNKEDGGNRRFILVEMEDYADTITAERVRHVIKGVPKSKNFQEGTGGSFSYFKLGAPIEMEHILHGDRLPSYEELARYVFYTATGEEFNAEDISTDKKKPFIGKSKYYPGGVYLFYEPRMEHLMNTALTLDMARALGKHNNKRRLVFAPMKYLDQDYLDEMRIDYSQLPFEIYKFKG